MGSSDGFLEGRLAGILSALQSGSNRLRREYVSRMLRSAPPFAAWCAADPGSIAGHEKFGSRLCGAASKRRCTASGTRETRSTWTRPFAKLNRLMIWS